MSKETDELRATLVDLEPQVGTYFVGALGDPKLIEAMLDVIDAAEKATLVFNGETMSQAIALGNLTEALAWFKEVASG